MKSVLEFLLNKNVKKINLFPNKKKTPAQSCVKMKHKVVIILLAIIFLGLISFALGYGTASDHHHRIVRVGVEDELCEGDLVLFASTSSPFSWGVRNVCRSPLTHVGLFIDGRVVHLMKHANSTVIFRQTPEEIYAEQSASSVNSAKQWNFILLGIHMNQEFLPSIQRIKQRLAERGDRYQYQSNILKMFLETVVYVNTKNTEKKPLLGLLENPEDNVMQCSEFVCHLFSSTKVIPPQPRGIPPMAVTALDPWRGQRMFLVNGQQDRPIVKKWVNLTRD
jgi:hypothetical protein